MSVQIRQPQGQLSFISDQVTDSTQLLPMQAVMTSVPSSTGKLVAIGIDSIQRPAASR